MDDNEDEFSIFNTPEEDDQPVAAGAPLAILVTGHPLSPLALSHKYAQPEYSQFHISENPMTFDDTSEGGGIVMLTYDHATKQTLEIVIQEPTTEDYPNGTDTTDA